MNQWEELRSLLEARHSEYAHVLNPPATPEHIAALETRLGRKLPEALREIYENADGQSASTPGVLVGMTLLPIQRVIEEAESWSELDAHDFDSEDFTSAPPDAIKLEYTNRLWLPVCDTGGGNHVGLDFDPGPTGTPGQVINFGRDQVDKCVLADSLERFLIDCIEIVRQGDGLEFHSNGLVDYHGRAFPDALIAEKFGSPAQVRNLDPGTSSIWVSRSAAYPEDYFNVSSQGGLSADFKIAAGGDFQCKNFVNSDRSSALNLDLLFRLDNTLGGCKTALQKRFVKLGITEAHHLCVIVDYDHAKRHPTISSSTHATFVGSFPVK